MVGSSSVVSFSASALAINRNPTGWNPETTVSISP
jgi:hypothetical protein